MGDIAEVVRPAIVTALYCTEPLKLLPRSCQYQYPFLALVKRILTPFCIRQLPVANFIGGTVFEVFSVREADVQLRRPQLCGCLSYSIPTSSTVCETVRFESRQGNDCLALGVLRCLLTSQWPSVSEEIHFIIGTRRFHHSVHVAICRSVFVLSFHPGDPFL